ncbi:MAG: protein phosphatase 2C domain-containing protein [Nocardioidaceae bacterium]
MASETSRLRLRYSALSDLGRYRKDNQDAGYAGPHLLAIADGVGGAAYGDVASHTAITTLQRLDEPPAGDLLEALAGAVHRVHDRIAELVERDPELMGTSTTVTAGLFDGTRLGVAHVGDSRAYRLRDGEITQLTKDHTFVQSLVDEGRITEEESRTHPHRNLILRAVDGVHETAPDLFHVDLEPGDRLLFCSDGASGPLDNTRMAAELGRGTVDYAAVAIVRTALDLGTTDNVTVLVADVERVPRENERDQAGEPSAEEAAGQTAGAMLVGSAAVLPRKLDPDARHTAADLPPVPGEADRDGNGDWSGDVFVDNIDDIDPEEQRYALRAPRRLLWLRRLAYLSLTLLLIVGLGAAAYRWTQKQYYVSVSDGYVTIFRGVAVNPPGVSLNSVVERSRITIESLPAYNAEQVRDGIDADSLADARRIMDESLMGLARTCDTPSAATPTPTPPASTKKASPTKTPSKKATKTPAATPSKAPSKTPSKTPSSSPTASPTPTIAPPDCIEATP